MVVSKSVDYHHASGSNETPKPNNDTLKSLEKRIASQLCDDGVSIDSV